LIGVEVVVAPVGAEVKAMRCIVELSRHRGGGQIGVEQSIIFPAAMY
jgi:hypothetical protein